MMRKTHKYPRFILVLLIAVIWLPATGYSQEYRGQLSGWMHYQKPENSETNMMLGARYLPEFTYNFTVQAPYMIDAEISANIYGYHDSKTNGDAEPYRLWVRYATHKFESRLGLQKINFGPAKLLRSEMWFDRLDPRDPLQLTQGVYALRLRYDFENLSNIWLWGIYGEDETKGLEFIPSKEGSPEMGGRYQHPVGTGEMAVSFHHRKVPQDYLIDFSKNAPYTSENRIALDGIWDVGVGIWFETALIHADLPAEQYQWQSFQTVGIDYTFPIGNGAYVSAEHMLVTVSDQMFDLDEDIQTSGFMASYPIGWLDQIALYSIFNWDAEMAYHYISWQRTYDRWVLHASLFSRTGDDNGGFLNQPVTTVGKYGVQLMVIFNH